MTFVRPTLETLKSRTKSDIETNLNTGPLLERSVLFVLSQVLSGLSHLLHGHIEFISKQILADTADSEYLSRHANIWGINRSKATFATGQISITGNNNIVIPINTVFTGPNNVQYRTTEAVTIEEGTATANISAELAGITGNLSEGQVLTINNVISGVDASATVSSVALTGGANEESDESLRQRLLDRIKQPPQGGASYDYKAWALEISAISRAFVIPHNRGIGTVDIAVLDDTKSPPSADSATILLAQENIDLKRPVTADVVVFTPTIQAENLEISISPDTTLVMSNIQAALEDLFKR